MENSLIRCAAGILFAAAIATVTPVSLSFAASDIGKTVIVVRTVTGTLQTEVRQLLINDNVSQNELISTAPDAASEIEFVDGTKLSLGPRARVVLDKFVYDPDPSRGAFFLTVSEGVFRFVTGKMAHQSYAISTPNGTVGVRGTVFNLLVLGDKTICQVVDGEVFGKSADGDPKMFNRGEYFTMRGRTGASPWDDKTIIDTQVALMDFYIKNKQYAGLGIDPGHDTHPFQAIIPKTASVSPTTTP
jgi:hypothetical protein